MAQSAIVGVGRENICLMAERTGGEGRDWTRIVIFNLVGMRSRIVENRDPVGLTAISSMVTSVTFETIGTVIPVTVSEAVFV